MQSTWSLHSLDRILSPAQPAGLYCINGDTWSHEMSCTDGGGCSASFYPLLCCLQLQALQDTWKIWMEHLLCTHDSSGR